MAVVSPPGRTGALRAPAGDRGPEPAAPHPRRLRHASSPTSRVGTRARRSRPSRSPSSQERPERLVVTIEESFVGREDDAVPLARDAGFDDVEQLPDVVGGALLVEFD